MGLRGKSEAVADELDEMEYSPVGHKGRALESKPAWYTSSPCIGAMLTLLLVFFIGCPIVVVPAGHAAVIDFYGRRPGTRPLC